LGLRLGYGSAALCPCAGGSARPPNPNPDPNPNQVALLAPSDPVSRLPLRLLDRSVHRQRAPPPTHAGGGGGGGGGLQPVWEASQLPNIAEVMTLHVHAYGTYEPSVHTGPRLRIQGGRGGLGRNLTGAPACRDGSGSDGAPPTRTFTLTRTRTRNLTLALTRALTLTLTTDPDPDPYPSPAPTQA